jgi:hypothetical protein
MDSWSRLNHDAASGGNLGSRSKHLELFKRVAHSRSGYLSFMAGIGVLNVAVRGYFGNGQGFLLSCDQSCRLIFLNRVRERVALSLNKAI